MSHTVTGDMADPLAALASQCLFGQYRMPMLATPYMLNAAQFDKFQLPYNIGAYLSYPARRCAPADAVSKSKP